MDLDEIMTVGRVVCVHADGSVSDAPDGVQAPQLEMGSLDDEAGSILAEHEEDYAAQAIRQGWEVMTAGYTRQYGYRGIVMHESELIGGLLERDILAAPGCYVALEVQMADGRDHDPGWVVARRTVSSGLAAATLSVEVAKVQVTTALDEVHRALALARECGVPEGSLPLLAKGFDPLSEVIRHKILDAKARVYAREPRALARYWPEPNW